MNERVHETGGRMLSAIRRLESSVRAEASLGATPASRTNPVERSERPPVATKPIRRTEPVRRPPVPPDGVEPSAAAPMVVAPVEVPVPEPVVDQAGTPTTTPPELADDFRQIGVRLAASLGSGDALIVLVASEQNLTTKRVAGPLAAALQSATNQPLLLVDANPASADADRILHHAIPTIHEVLRGDRPLTDVVQKTAFAGLSYLPLGAAPLGNSGTFKSFWTGLKDQFPCVIVDGGHSPPAELVAAADRIELVFELGRTPLASIRQVRRRIESAGGKLSGTIGLS